MYKRQFNNYFTSFRVQDSGSVSYLQVSTVGQNSNNVEATLIASDGNFKLLPWEATGSAGGGSTVLEVPLSRHEPFTIVNQDLTLQGGNQTAGNVSGSSTSTGSFGRIENGTSFFDGRRIGEIGQSTGFDVHAASSVLTKWSLSLIHISEPTRRS